MRDLLTIRRAKIGALAVTIVEIADEIRRQSPGGKHYADKVEELAISIMNVKDK